MLPKRTALLGAAGSRSSSNGASTAALLLHRPGTKRICWDVTVTGETSAAGNDDSSIKLENSATLKPL
jgi:hypothetical protein